MTHVTELTAYATSVRADNPGPMTLEGTNSYVLRGPISRSSIVVDPGPLDEAHLWRLEQFGPIELILLTHRHIDHVEAAPELSRRTGAPVRAVDPSLTIQAPVLADGEVIRAAGCEIEVIATPGHSDDSVSFLNRADSSRAAAGLTGTMLTGDAILGRGTTVLVGGETALRDYLGSLERYRSHADAFVLPAHAQPLSSLHRIATELYDHRRARLDQVHAALESAALRPDDPRAVDVVLDQVYADVAPQVRRAAEESVRAQLNFFIQETHGGA